MALPQTFYYIKSLPSTSDQCSKIKIFSLNSLLYFPCSSRFIIFIIIFCTITTPEHALALYFLSFLRFWWNNLIINIGVEFMFLNCSWLWDNFDLCLAYKTIKVSFSYPWEGVILLIFPIQINHNIPVKWKSKGSLVNSCIEIFVPTNPKIKRMNLSLVTDLPTYAQCHQIPQ